MSAMAVRHGRIVKKMEPTMAKQITRDRKLTPQEAENYRKLREEIEGEKPEIIAKAQRARRGKPRG